MKQGVSTKDMIKGGTILTSGTLATDYLTNHTISNYAVSAPRRIWNAVEGVAGSIGRYLSNQFGDLPNRISYQFLPNVTEGMGLDEGVKSAAEHYIGAPQAVGQRMYSIGADDIISAVILLTLALGFGINLYRKHKRYNK